jgi:hypothetical protein
VRRGEEREAKMRTVTVTILICLAVAMVGNSVEEAHGDSAVEELSPHEVAPLAVAPKQKFTAAEKKEFHQIIGELSRRVGAESAHEIGKAFGEEIHAYLEDRKLGEGEGLNGLAKSKFIGGLAKMASAAGGSGMITKLLDPLLMKLPAEFRPLVKSLVPHLLKGDINGMKGALIGGVIGIAKIKFINPVIKKLPEEFRPMMNDAVDKLLDGLKKFPKVSIDVKALKEVLKKGVMDYGVKKVESVVGIVTAQLPDFAKEPAKSAVMDLVKQQSAALLSKLEADELGEKQKDETGFDPGKLIIGEGVKAVKGMAPGMIEKMVAKLPGPLAPAKEPLKEAVTGMVEKIMDVLAEPSNWNEKGKEKIVNILMATGMDLGAKLKSALPIEYDTQLGEDVAKIRKETGRYTLGEHLGTLSRHLAGPVSRSLGESMSKSFTDALTKDSHGVLHEHDEEDIVPQRKDLHRSHVPAPRRKFERKGKPRAKKRMITHPDVYQGHLGESDQVSSGYGGGSKKKGKKGGGMFGKLAGMAKKAGGAAMKMGGGGMLKPLISPLLAKIPAAFRPMIEGAIMKLVGGDVPGAKKALKDGVPTVAVTLLETMPKGSPIMHKVPEEFRPLVKDTLMQLLKGDIKGAVAVLKQKVIAYGVKKIETLVTPMVAKIPFPPLQEPAKKFLLDNIKAIASQHVAEERRRALGEVIAEDTRTNEQVGLDITKLVMGEGVKLIGGVVPPAIDDLVAKLPSALAPAKPPLKEVLKKLFTDLVGVLGQGPSKWNADGMKECTELIIAAAKGLADKLKAAGLQAMGMGGGDGDDVRESGGKMTKKNKQRIKYRFSKAAIARVQQLRAQRSLDLHVEDSMAEEEEEYA